MEFGKAFSFVFEDQDWVKKIGIAGLLLIIPILGGLVVSGWALEVTRRVIHREAEVLPDWSKFGDYLVKGLMLFVVGFVYALPIILLSACQQGGILFAQNNGDDSLTGVIGVLSICISCVVILYSIVLGFVIPAAYARLAVTGQIGSAFRFGEVIGLVRAAPSAYLIVFLGEIIAGFIGSLGLIVCVIGMFFTYAYAMAMMAHLWGQAYNVASGDQSLQPAY
ncbi:MAG: DUF4013 domain-containing protein [Anaerolineae bacterium]|jgi:hypothetical protein|nr:DUF4013 domain-containing protein [Anaerolineae bacterium]MCZ7552731.1 DUF4013 domain-containing protein [Anaerolineales bacterium]